MSNNGTHRRSFTKLTIVTLLAIGLAGVGWKVSGQHNVTSTGTLFPRASVVTRNVDGALATAAVVTPQGTYLDVKEIGVHILLNGSIPDAVYAPFDVAPTDGSQVYGISAQSLISQDAKGYCSAASGALGLIIATTNPTVVTGAHTSSQLVPDNKTIFKYGSTYVRYVPPQNYGCAVGQITTAAVAGKQAAFAQAFATLQPDNQ